MKTRRPLLALVSPLLLAATALLTVLSMAQTETATPPIPAKSEEKPAETVNVPDKGPEKPATKAADTTPAGNATVPEKSDLPEKKPVVSPPVPAPAAARPVPTGPREEGQYTGKVVVIPVGERDLLNPARFEFMSRTLERATKQGAEAVIFNLDTPGGIAWNTTTLIMQDLEKLGCPSASFVNPRAISAGAIIAIGTDAIYMSPRSSIGAASPVEGSGMPMGDAERAKTNSAFMAMARSAAVAKGHNPAVVNAMIDKDTGIKIGDKEIWPKGSPATLDQVQATTLYDGKPLLAKGIVRSLEELKDKEGYKGELVTAEPKGFELVAIWITQYAAILLLIGLAAGYLEMQTPGMGVPAIIAAIAFGLFFFGHSVAGSLIGYETVVIFVIGIALIVVELFVFPGHLLPGLLGFIGLAGALIYTMAGWDITVPEGHSFPVRWEDYVTALRNIGIAFAGTIVLILLFMRFFPTSGPFGWLVLQSTVGGEQAAIEGEGQRQASAVSAGTTGVTRSAMRPYGHVDFNGLQLEAMVEGDYITPGTKVRVREVHGGKIVVERI